MGLESLHRRAPIIGGLLAAALLGFAGVHATESQHPVGAESLHVVPHEMHIDQAVLDGMRSGQSMQVIIELPNPAEGKAMPNQHGGKMTIKDHEGDELLVRQLEFAKQYGVAVVEPSFNLDTLANEGVPNVYVDGTFVPDLVEARKILGADKMFNKGYDGSSKTVVMIGEGAEDTAEIGPVEPFQYCFSAKTTTASNGNKRTSVCPDGNATQEGVRVAQISTQPADTLEHDAWTATSLYAISNAKKILMKVGEIWETKRGTVYMIHWSEVLEALTRLNQLNLGESAVVMPFGTVNTYAGASNGLLPPLDDQLKLLQEKAVVAIATGNAGAPDEISYPAANVYHQSNYHMDAILAVSATNHSGTAIDGRFANTSAQVDVVAPGGDLVWNRTDPTKTVVFSGTSFSAPMAAGAVAIMSERFPSLTPAQIAWLLYKSGTSVDDQRVSGTQDYRLIKLTEAERLAGVIFEPQSLLALPFVGSGLPND